MSRLWPLPTDGRCNVKLSMPMPKYLTYLAGGLLVAMANCKLEVTRRLARTVGSCPVLVCDRAATVEAY